MLVLSRFVGEDVIIKCGGQRITVRLVNSRNGKARIGFEADESVTIHRQEVQDEIDAHEQAVAKYAKAGDSRPDVGSERARKPT